MKNNRNISILLLAAFVIIGLAAFLVFGGRSDRQETTQSSVENKTDLVIESPATDTPQLASDLEVEGSQVTKTPQELDQAAPTPRGELASTSPSTVNLASGEIQLVEFFAFW